MPPSPSRSPPPASTPNADEAQLPKGQCRYILMIPELKGQRCGCMGFDHNKALPGATCNCGHLSCFHITSADPPSPGKNRAEIETVKQRLQALEENADRSDHDRLCGVVSRISELEETVERSKEEALSEIKGSYRNSFAAWQLVEQLQKRMKDLEELYQAQSQQIAKAGKEVDDLRNRQLELLDSDEILEERIEKLESSELLLSPPQDPAPTDSSFDTLQLSTHATTERPRQLKPSSFTSSRSSSSSRSSRPWTIHISLMPSKEQPFPFEKDTTAYKRCLSRGLHRMVAVEGDDPQSFSEGVSRAFGSLLNGRSWMPLQAKLCDAEKLQGLPMLRPLEPRLAHGKYDRDFIRQHCAVIDANGKLDSLYIAMEHDTLSWKFLRRSPKYLEGLESSWEHDVYLDQKDEKDPTVLMDYFIGNYDDQSLTSNITASFTSLKRNVSEVSCSSALDDAEGSRTKIPRTCKSGRMDLRRGVETAR
ncbi:hypothetical protein BGZ61DRAFT_463998 [Ilyonectria robusta]|uniref:uncharacterized protein n=1 Tax=Ilyonectria robusta TaxID=1079257 RepID=UPI001E8E5ABA|nr:uncharacterized protein BGZ61DRAFT_463998 [Ilyonectria robusta]KAH8661310.1 hypothetical protein BGZ61DRAFT_463998 [Ilyonectria robusta]